jgi:putative endonuclease
MKKQYYVYILTNFSNKVIYTGVTSNLVRRIFEHKNKLVDGFTKKYNITKLAYYECLDNSYSAISREKQIKGGSRRKKIDLIIKQNPNFDDLYGSII